MCGSEQSDAPGYLKGDVDDTLKRLVQQISTEKRIDLIACETAVDHMHVLLRADTREELSRAMNYIKGLSAKRLFEQMPELRMDMGTSNLWQHRYGAKVVPEDALGTVKRYIETQKDRLEKYER